MGRFREAVLAAALGWASGCAQAPGAGNSTSVGAASTSASSATPSAASSVSSSRTASRTRSTSSAAASVSSPWSSSSTSTTGGATTSSAASPDAGPATFYDPINGVTWLADANLPASNRFGLPLCNGSATKVCVNASGSMAFQGATAWVAAMNDAGYLGHGNWQLPTTPANEDGGCVEIGTHGNSFGFNCTQNALGSLYYETLGLQAPDDALPASNVASGPFSNFQPDLYWSQTDAGAAGIGTFSFNTGFQGANTLHNYLHVVPVIPGPVAGADAGQIVYDPVSNVSWLADANVAATNGFGLPVCTALDNPKPCVSPSGAMSWDAASQLVQNMNADGGYLGQTRWALPTTDPSCNVSYACGVDGGSPFASLYYGLLGLSPGVPVVATPDVAVGPLTNLQPYLYWSCQGDGPLDNCADAGPATGFQWTFSFANGFLGTDVLENEFYVTAYYVGP